MKTLKAIDPLEVHIEQDNIGEDLRSRQYRFLATEGDCCSIPLCFQIHLYQFGYDAFIIHDKNSAGIAHQISVQDNVKPILTLMQRDPGCLIMTGQILRGTFEFIRGWFYALRMTTLQTKANIILFVDDEENILNSLKRELHGWAKEHALVIKTAPSATIALNIIESSAPEIAVLVSDLKMPEMLGSDFLLAVKQRWPDIITILLTGYSETQEVMKAVKAGIFSYILKPWEQEYLKNELEKALDMRLVKQQG
jgi:CheY-like chemotaxis protein